METHLKITHLKTINRIFKNQKLKLKMENLQTIKIITCIWKGNNLSQPSSSSSFCLSASPPSAIFLLLLKHHSFLLSSSSSSFFLSSSSSLSTTWNSKISARATVRARAQGDDANARARVRVSLCKSAGEFLFPLNLCLFIEFQMEYSR